LNTRRLGQWKTLLITMFALLLVAEVCFVIWQERTQVLAATAQKTGSALIDFAQACAQQSRRKTDESFERYEQRISKENSDTQSLYSKQYSLEVAHLRDSFARLGLKRPELDGFYQRPGSTIAIREIGRTLLDMGTALRSEGVSVVIKGWLRLIHSRLLLHSKFEGSTAERAAWPKTTRRNSGLLSFLKLRKFSPSNFRPHCTLTASLDPKDRLSDEEVPDNFLDVRVGRECTP